MFSHECDTEIVGTSVLLKINHSTFKSVNEQLLISLRNKNAKYPFNESPGTDGDGSSKWSGFVLCSDGSVVDIISACGSID